MSVESTASRRAAWSRHPNFPNQVLLVGSHDNFRRLSASIQQDVAANSVPRYAARLFRRWMMAMGGHEHYEESKLYPYLTHRYGACMDHLREGHAQLDACRAAVYRAFDEVIEARYNEGRAGDALRAAYDLFHATLLAHLELEEDTVVPLLLDLQPAEFFSYTTHSIAQLLSAPSETSSAFRPA